ncbi:protein-disulfide reductase DsbD domain-containing protein [Methylocapsa aurea]|uniref:protein-disulfide reductase DsbD domain-containing protein n=1 Tax=Methylocapsa aurea TaxID=663610 RepID=UPI00138E4E53|nr:protein-disulfide reductase DsbD domain-containing protein [Methylocapsa aurea]
MRLIAVNQGPAQGFYRAGAEIRLDPGAITYWRTPGEAGAPPVFDFEGSENVADVAVLYPVPTRIDESGTEVYGYRQEVIFPLHVTPKDGARPALLALTLKFAVCERICLPAQAEANLPLAPLKGVVTGGAGGGQEAALAMAEATVPARLTAMERDAKIAIARDRGQQAPTWRLTIQNRETKPAEEAQDPLMQDLFAEAPEGWFFETRKADRPNEFLIVESERPKADAGPPPPVVLTLKQPGRSYEFTAELGGASLVSKDR